MMGIFKGLYIRLLSFLAAVLALFNLTLPCTPPPAENNTGYVNVLVHGLMGWGSYDFYYNAMPYWGMLGGDAVQALRLRSYDCRCASVAPSGSAWDRACELYAQLTGTRVDYGEAHSEKYGHERFGKDYTGKALLDGEWNTENKINLIGHSFGGVTVRLLAQFMEYGDEAERERTAQTELSGLFSGGNGGRIYSITTLSAPHNGTSAYESEQWADEDAQDIEARLRLMYNKIDPSGIMFDTIISMHSDKDGNILPDTAHYDMQIDNAAKLNESLTALDDIYYFSYATCVTNTDENMNQLPERNITEPLFYTRSIGIGKNRFVTPGGTVIDDKWLANDGLVNTYSALAPFNEPQTEYSAQSVSPGVWNIMPVTRGSHTYFMGNLLKTTDIVPFFSGLFDMINGL